MKSFFTAIFLHVMFFSIMSISHLAAEEYYKPVADAYVRGGENADVNHGAEELLRVRGSNSEDNRRKVYMKFDLTEFSFADVGYATLWLTVDRAVGGGNIDRADFYTVSDDSWEESEITWNNAPAPERFLFSVNFQRQISTNEDIVYELDVSEYIAEEVADDKIVTIYMYDDSLADTDTRIFSRETVNPPELEIGIPYSVKANSIKTPDNVALIQNYPNPFNASTLITYTIPKREMVCIDVYSILGRKIKSLVNGIEPAGTRVVKWDGKDDNNMNMPTGIYLARLQFEDTVKTIKLLLSK
ncbi:T9SS type A sorting domain-containing protein [candidate division KSB1 bacterium]|nr:T9SS type A sorting domain-containing protein [candidate division KSB1 bacterium]